MSVCLAEKAGLNFLIRDILVNGYGYFLEALRPACEKY